jgi:hypothetical protein
MHFRFQYHHRLDFSVLLICTYLLDCLRPSSCGRLLRCNYSGSRYLGAPVLDERGLSAAVVLCQPDHLFQSRFSIPCWWGLKNGEHQFWMSVNFQLR